AHRVGLERRRRVELAENLIDYGHELIRATGSSDQKMEICFRSLQLPVGLVVCQRVFLAQGEILAVPGDPNNRDWQPVSKADGVADWIYPAKNPFADILIQDGDGRRTELVRSNKRAAMNDRDLQRLEVVGTDVVIVERDRHRVRT